MNLASESQTTVQCSECGNFYQNKKALKLHMAVHRPRTYYKCDECGKTFTQKTYRNSHMLSHRGEMPYKCTHCDKSFFMKKHLHRHLESHARERPHICVECGKAFPENYKLLVHMRKHTGEKPYSCTRCAKTFTKYEQCANHIRRECGPAAKGEELRPQVKRAPHFRSIPRKKPPPPTLIYTIITTDQIGNLGNTIVLPCEIGTSLATGNQESSNTVVLPHEITDSLAADSQGNDNTVVLSSSSLVANNLGDDVLLSPGVEPPVSSFGKTEDLADKGMTLPDTFLKGQITEEKREKYHEKYNLYGSISSFFSGNKTKRSLIKLSKKLQPSNSNRAI
ncbi:zinc finger protein 91-like [Penaeus monodon]|uniref:zinc finger protein 91-like n=1 Tax=Penaeus monodon TaxID=6687 RepID=UPI0018A7439C|nr:zinc finger protein 91-like [Penaeus monodon]